MFLVIYPGPRVEAYCRDCYDYLWDLAAVHLPELPPLNGLRRKALDFSTPEYLIKENSLLQLFFPTDPITLGAIRQKRRRERGQVEKEEKR